MYDYSCRCHFSCATYQIVLNYVLIIGIGNFQGLGYMGAPIATSVCRIVQLVGMLVLTVQYSSTSITCSTVRETFRCTGMLQYLRFAIPGMLQLVIEKWGFEITTIISSRLGAVNLAAHSAA